MATDGVSPIRGGIALAACVADHRRALLVALARPERPLCHGRLLRLTEETTTAPPVRRPMDEYRLTEPYWLSLSRSNTRRSDIRPIPYWAALQQANSVSREIAHAEELQPRASLPASGALSQPEAAPGAPTPVRSFESPPAWDGQRAIALPWTPTGDDVRPGSLIDVVI